MPILTEHQRLPTSGARAVAPFRVGGALLLAVPQLAVDAPGTPRGMNGGDSETHVVIFEWRDGAFVERDRLTAHGGEDAEFFRIGDEAFLAVACARSGRGPYDLNTTSSVYRWDGTHFMPWQTFDTYAAKQWRHFSLDGRHFLALAQGVTADPTNPPRVDPDSRVFEWDHTRFVPAQALDASGGRSMVPFAADGEHYLLFANLLNPSRLLQWDGREFVHRQALEGAGARMFAVDGRFVVRVDFMLGSRAQPQPVLQSQIYAWDGELHAVETFTTSGGTDAAFFEADGSRWLAVSNSLSASLEFRVDTVIYRFDDGA